MAAPRILRACARCHATTPFVSSGNFRVNANGRRLDVWLIYRCGHCDRTWNRTVFERVSPEQLGADLPRYEANDAELASQVAADPGPFPIEAPEWELTGDLCAGEVLLRVPPGARVRLDALLVRASGLSRSAIQKAARRELGKSLGKPVFDGQRLSLPWLSDPRR